MSNHNLQKYATLQVPRYTSYPTAPHFGAEVTPKTYTEWLSALDPEESISLYLHVPYCRQLCWYCGCNMKLASRPEPVTDYVHTLIREIELLADHLPGRFRLSHLHWGGGTPTAMAPEELAEAMGVVRRYFDVDGAAELAIEGDPRTLTQQMIDCIGEQGFTRASFGVQEFDKRVQAAINRIQPPDMVARSVEGLRAAGVSGINFDLIYGLPHQTVASLLETIRLCAEMKPDRIALFGYAHVPWMAKKQRLIDEAALPGASERIAQANAASEALRQIGYQAIGLDHFARPEDSMAVAARDGKLQRNFQGYTTDCARTLLGVGSTSIGQTPFGYVQNVAATGVWQRMIESGQLPIARGYAFQGEDRVRGHIINRLMCQGTVDIGEAATAHTMEPGWEFQFEAYIEELCADGLVIRDGSRISVTETGAQLVRVVASTFDEYLPHRLANHAVAV